MKKNVRYCQLNKLSMEVTNSFSVSATKLKFSVIVSLGLGWKAQAQTPSEKQTVV